MRGVGFIDEDMFDVVIIDIRVYCVKYVNLLMVVFKLMSI